MNKGKDKTIKEGFFIEVTKEIPTKIRFLRSDTAKCSSSCQFFLIKLEHSSTRGSVEVFEDRGQYNCWAEISCGLFHSSLPDTSGSLVHVDNINKHLEEHSQRLEKCIETFGK